MTTITRERAQEIFLGNGPEPTASEQRELARIALASLEREQVRREHAEFSDKTFGDVGPVGPLKHLSKEALEAAAEPDDLSEWADMQFLLWDAQRRAGITDEQVTQAMVDKLKVNKQREWPEPKDGKPRLHIKEQPAPVVPEEHYQRLSQLYHAQEKRLFKIAQRIKGPAFDKYSHSPSQAIDVLESALFGENEATCRAAMLQGSQPVSNRDELLYAQVKAVADLYALCWQSGEVVTYTPDPEKATIWLNNYSGTCAQEYVKLERLQEALAGNSPVIPEDLRRAFEAVARLNNEMYCWTSCMSYNGSYNGEPEGLLKRNIREIEHIMDSCRATMLQANQRDLSQPVDPQVADYEKTMLQAGNSPVIPDGWALVPIVPTEDMVINGFESEPDPHFSDEKVWAEYEALSGCRRAARRAELCWAAMIKAAPKPEAGPCTK